MDTQTQMKKYFGSKNLFAKPMTLGEYNEYRKWTIPENEDPSKEGYLVEYEDGYQSWSPKENFDNAYREITALTIGQAIEALKKGMKVARSGWNVKGMYLVMQEGFSIASSEVNVSKKNCLVTRSLENDNPETINVCPHIDMRAADGSVVIGWLASQTDMLADDWQIVD